MELGLNLVTLAILVACLLVMQTTSGLIEGFFLPITPLGQSLGLGLSFVLSLAVFAVFSFKSADRPHIHAAVALGIYVGLGLVLAGVLGSRIQSISWEQVVFQWTILALSMGFGVPAGRAARRMARGAANA